MLQAQQVDRDAALELELGTEALEQVIEAVGPPITLDADPGRPDPRQVVQPHVLDGDGIGIDAEVVPDPSLRPDGHVAQPHGVMTLVQQRLRDDPDRIGEVDQPGPAVGTGRHLLRQLQHDGHGAQRLGQPPCSRGLLTQASVPDRQRLVDVARRLAPDAQLDHHEVGPLQGGVRVGGRRERPAPSPRPQNALGEPSHHLSPQVARIEQDEIVDDHPVLHVAETVDQLRGVGASAADDNHLGPHAAQRNIRPCPNPPISSRPCWRSTGAAPRPMSSSSRGWAPFSAGPRSARATTNSSASKGRCRRCPRRSPRSPPTRNAPTPRRRSARPASTAWPASTCPSTRRSSRRRSTRWGGPIGSSCATTRSPSHGPGRRPPGASASSAERA